MVNQFSFGKTVISSSTFQVEKMSFFIREKDVFQKILVHTNRNGKTQKQNPKIVMNMVVGFLCYQLLFEPLLLSLQDIG